MESFEIYCVQEEGNNYAKLFLKQDPKWHQTSMSTGVRRFHVSHNFGLGQPGGHTVPALTQPPHSSLEASVYALFLMAHLELDASSLTVALLSIMWAHTV